MKTTEGKIDWEVKEERGTDKCGNSDCPFVHTEIVRDQLHQMNVDKFM